MSQLTHLNASGEAHMVDVSAKAETVREARAEAFVTMNPETLAMIVDGSHHKGMSLRRHVSLDPSGKKYVAVDPTIAILYCNQSGDALEAQASP